MRIAVDVNISNQEIGALAREGDQVVCVALPREDDQKWLERALARDCDVIISQDLDIPNILDRWRVAEDVLWFEKLEHYRKWRGKHAAVQGKKV